MNNDYKLTQTNESVKIQKKPDAKIVNTFLLCSFLGLFSIHNFYNKKYITGLIHLSFISLIILLPKDKAYNNLSDFLFLGSCIWVLFDWISIIKENYKNSDNIKLKWDTNRHGDYAGFKIRLCAFIIDCIILVILPAIAIIIGLYFLGIKNIEDIKENNLNVTSTEILCYIIVGLAFISFLVVHLYPIIKNASRDQATIGKKICKIHIITTKGKRLTIFRSIGRSLSLILTCFFLPLYIINPILIAFTKKKIGLHDFITRTHVIYGTMPKNKQGELD